jgi:hypothetical protein
LARPGHDPKLPEVRQLNGEDPTAFVLSANVHRRHLTKGQRAMAVAMILPEPEKGGRGRKSSVSDGFDVSRTRVKYARTVLSVAPDMAANILSSAMPLDGAYQAVLRFKSEIGGVNRETEEPWWDQCKRHRWASEPPPPDWPKGVRPISMEGASLFGLDDRGRLYWDGEGVVVTRKLELTPWQKLLAGTAAVVGILVGLTELASFFGFEHASDLWERHTAAQAAVYEPHQPDVP